MTQSILLFGLIIDSRIDWEFPADMTHKVMLFDKFSVIIYKEKETYYLPSSTPNTYAWLEHSRYRDLILSDIEKSIHKIESNKEQEEDNKKRRSLIANIENHKFKEGVFVINF